MYIYAIGTEDKQKIGFSKDPDSRVKSLQTSNSEELSLHFSFEVSSKTVRKFEMHIHKENSHKRLKGEWFDMKQKEVVNLLMFYEMMTETIEATF